MVFYIHIHRHLHVRSNRAKQVGSHKPRHLFEPRHRLEPRQGDQQRKQQDGPMDHGSDTHHIRKEQDKSMNRDEEFYQFPHIYDYLLSAAATPGGQWFRRRQQRLPKRQQKQL